MPPSSMVGTEGIEPSRAYLGTLTLTAPRRRFDGTGQERPGRDTVPGATRHCLCEPPTGTEPVTSRLRDGRSAN